MASKNPRLSITIQWDPSGEYVARAAEFPEFSGHSLWPMYALAVLQRALQDNELWRPDTLEERNG